MTYRFRFLVIPVLSIGESERMANFLPSSATYGTEIELRKDKIVFGIGPNVR